MEQKFHPRPQRCELSHDGNPYAAVMPRAVRFAYSLARALLTKNLLRKVGTWPGSDEARVHNRAPDPCIIKSRARPTEDIAPHRYRCK